MKVIDFETVKSICKTIRPREYAEWIKDALLHKDDFVMPVKSRINQEDGDYYAIMPCMHGENNSAMVKMIGRHGLKPGENRPTMMSDMLLYEADTGMLRALMDGEYITTLRTGAAAAFAAVMYGKKDFKTIGLIGLGNIMTVCVEVLLDLIPDRELVIRLYRHHDQEKRMADRFAGHKNVRFEFCDTYEETIRGAEVVMSAVTRVTEDFVDDSCYDEGCTVIPIMTLGFQNCDLFFDKVYADEIDQIRGFKYFDRFKAVYNTSDVMHGLKPGRENERERILVYFYGLAIHDLYFATKILERADEVKDTEYNYCKEKFFI